MHPGPREIVIYALQGFAQLLASLPFPPTTFAKLNKLGTHFQPGPAGCIHIDRKSDTAVFVQKLDHPSRFEEPRCIRHGEDA